MLQHAPLFQKIKEVMGKARHILAIAHENPDGDALGSTLALAHYLKHQKINHTVYCASPVPPHFTYLPYQKIITSELERVKKNEFDTIIILDSGDLEYAGVAELFRILKGLPIVINIDHHRTNSQYGHLNLVEPKASSTSEIIYHFLDYFRFPIKKDVATCLLTGILTDTGSFSNLATTPTAMAVASKLLSAGARVRDITKYTVRNKSLNQLKLWGRALARLKQDNQSGVVSTVITKKDLDELHVGDDGIEGIANFLNNLDGASAVMVLREKDDGIIKASLRTHHPRVDVSELAKKFGGGGHKKAAGFSVKGKIQKTKTGWKIV